VLELDQPVALMLLAVLHLIGPRPLASEVGWYGGVARKGPRLSSS
jgi:hypothetical protein